MTISAIAKSASLGLMLALGACQNPPQVTTSPLQNVENIVSPPSGAGADIISQGILNAQYNFNQAVQLGILSPTDPAPGCLNTVATLMGLGATAPAGFTPKITDLISAGSVGYIYIQQLKAATGSSLQISPQCEQLIGEIVIDANKVGLKVGTGIIGGGLLTGGIPVPLLPVQ